MRAAKFSILNNVGQMTIKLVAAALTGSVSLLSEGLHSVVDLASSILTFLAVRVADVTPQEEHPYGHGKVESQAGVGEGLILVCLLIFIGYESIHKLFESHLISRIQIGLVLTTLSLIETLAVMSHVRSAAESTGSAALRANAKHLSIDAVTTGGVLLALLIAHFTGWANVDGLMGLILTLWMASGAFKLIRDSIHELLDHRVEPEEIVRIIEILKSEKDLMSYHRLRTRHSGSWHFVDVHIVVPTDWSVVQAHELADRIEKKIELVLRPAQVVIHVDPYDPTKVGL